MIIKLLTEHHLEFLSLKGGCRGSSKSTLVKISYCWKSHAAAHISVPKSRVLAHNNLRNLALLIHSCIMMYIKVAKIPRIIKAQIMAASTLSGLKERERDSNITVVF